jgi:hypothetical protein
VTSQSTIDLLRYLAGKPGHDEVKAGFWKLLIDEFGAELSALDFERRVPVVRGRLDALIGRTVFEAKSDLAKELADVERKMPEYLDFPDTFCRDRALFDKAIERMRSGSEAGMTRAQIEAALYRITEQHYRADVTEEQKLAVKDLGKTYVIFDKLRRDGRDSVWAYVARNLSRPLAFSASGGWASVVIGNPPGSPIAT